MNICLSDHVTEMQRSLATHWGPVDYYRERLSETDCAAGPSGCFFFVKQPRRPPPALSHELYILTHQRWVHPSVLPHSPAAAAAVLGVCQILETLRAVVSGGGFVFVRL